jgi:adenylate cyclase
MLGLKRRGRLIRWLQGLAVGAVVALGGLSVVLTNLGQDFEKNFGLTWLFGIRGAIEAPRDIVIVAINPNTAERLGLPPLPRDWPRSVHARLIDSLVARGASVIVFDLDLQRSRSTQDDLAFAKAVADAGRVILFEMLDGQRQAIFNGKGAQVGLVWKERLIEPAAPLADAAKALAPFPLPKDQIAVDTFWTFKPSVDAPTIPAAALQLHALGRHDKWLDLLERNEAPGVADLPRDLGPAARAQDVRALMRGLRRAFLLDPGLGKRITKDLDGAPMPGLVEADRLLFKALTGLYQGIDERFLNFYGPAGAITNIPYHAFLSEDSRFTEADLDLTGKTVFIGYSDLYNPGQVDGFYTVFTQRASEGGVDLSGVEIMATAFANLLTDRSVRPSDTQITVGIMLLFGLLVGGLSFIPHALAALPLALGTALLYAVAAQYAFDRTDLWLPLATPMLLQLPAALNRVVEGTCLATDMSGFTSISERMRPRELARFMNDYFDSLAAPLKQHAVDVTEFHADSIMCAWIEPEDTDGSASAGMADRQQAVLAALDVVDAVQMFLESHIGFQLNARVGLETGRFFLGHTGGGGRLAFSILGDCANTASRLEGLNKYLGTQILATGPVVEGLDDILLRPVGRFQFVGKADVRPVVEVLGKLSGLGEAKHRLCADFAEALSLFYARQWANAAALLDAILRDHPDDGPSTFYLERCRRYQAEAPDPDDVTVIRMLAK